MKPSEMLDNIISVTWNGTEKTAYLSLIAILNLVDVEMIITCLTALSAVCRSVISKLR